MVWYRDVLFSFPGDKADHGIVDRLSALVLVLRIVLCVAVGCSRTDWTGSITLLRLGIIFSLRMWRNGHAFIGHWGVLGFLGSTAIGSCIFCPGILSLLPRFITFFCLLLCARSRMFLILLSLIPRISRILFGYLELVYKGLSFLLISGSSSLVNLF